jgi:Zn-dependent alcohol dehydrogenase
MPASNDSSVRGPTSCATWRCATSARVAPTQSTRSRLLVDLYTDARLKLKELITRRFGLGEINAALRALAAGEVARAVVEIQ